MFDDNKVNPNSNPDELKPTGDVKVPGAPLNPINPEQDFNQSQQGRPLGSEQYEKIQDATTPIGGEQEWVKLEPEQSSYNPAGTPVASSVSTGAPRISVEQPQDRVAHRPDLNAGQELPKYKQPGYFQRSQQGNAGSPNGDAANYQGGQPYLGQQGAPQGQGYYGQQAQHAPQGQGYQAAQNGPQGYQQGPQAAQQGPVNNYGYQQNYQQFGQENTQPSTTAYIGMGLGIAALVIFIIPGINLLSPILAVIGLILSIMENKKNATGVGTAGIVCSIIALILSILVIVACSSCMCTAKDLHSFIR